MKQLIQAIIAALFVFACGGEDHTDVYDDAPDGGELGSQETGVWAEVGYGWQFGTGSASKCTTSSTQECYVPNGKTVQIWVDGTMMTAVEKQRVASALNWWTFELTNKLGPAGGWNFVYNNSNTGSADIRIVAGASGISQTVNGNLRKDYVKISCDNPGPIMTEGIFGAPGQYRFCNRLRATINFTNNDSKAAQLGLPASMLLSDTVGFIAAVGGGHGAINTAARVLNSTNVQPVDKFDVLGTNNICYAFAYDPTDPTTINTLTATCNP